MDISLDFETRSCNDVSVCGAYRYACDTTTSIICLAYDIDGKSGLWVPPLKCPFSEDECKTALFHAFNAGFERQIWEHICVGRLEWPSIPMENWRCTAARSLCNGLPGKLDLASKALCLTQEKDSRGHRIMLQLTKPRRPTKNDKRVWFDDFNKFRDCLNYCEQDVRVEIEIQEKTFGLTKRQRSDYLLSEQINDAGIPIDTISVGHALRLLGENKQRLQKKLDRLTGHRVQTARQVKAIREWLVDEGVNVGETLDKNDVEQLLSETEEDSLAHRVLLIRKELSQSATDKIKKMRVMACSDGRVRGCHIYHKSHTGRFAGVGLQTQNIVKGFSDADQIEEIFRQLPNSYDEFSEYCESQELGSVNTVISKLVRSFIRAEPGNVFLCVDYAAIEARVLAWLAGQDDALARFRKGVDQYQLMAEKIGVDRQLGKAIILGCGYQMGATTFGKTVRKWGMDVSDELAERCVTTYRQDNPRIAGERDAKGYFVKDGLWQKMEKSAIQCVANREFVEVNDKLAFDWRSNGDLQLILPSGRRINYHGAEVKNVTTKWGTRKDQVFYWGINSYTNQWELMSTYGGKLTENADQGVSADIMKLALRRLRNTGFNPIMHVHDEAICEVRQGNRSVTGMCHTMCELPSWAKGCPIEAEGKELLRYMKT